MPARRRIGPLSFDDMIRRKPQRRWHLSRLRFVMIASTVRIFVSTAPQDRRRSFDGLALAVRERLEQDARERAEPLCARIGRSHVRPPRMAERAASGRPKAVRR